jgi:hypothetical protein
MKRSQLNPLPTYFDRYINKTDDVDLHTALRTSLTELEHAPVGDWLRIGDRVYAPGKWTVKDILQHLIDTERVFSYRATAFARGDADQPSYDEDAYARAADATDRELQDLLDELIMLRKCTIAQFRSFTGAMLDRKGNGFKGPYSVRDIGFILPGHQRWHFEVISERYAPLG